MLVLGPGKPVGSVDVSPIKSLWDVFQFQVVPWKGAILSFKLFSKEFLEDAGWSLTKEIVSDWVSVWFFDSVLGGVSFILSPSISWNTPVAFSFDTEVVASSDDSEITVLTKVRTPRVSDEPVWDVLLNTVSDDGDSVVEFLSAGGIVDDSTLVVKETIGIEGADDWASLVDFVHHGFFTSDWTEFSDTVDWVIWWDEAALAWKAVLALDSGVALDTSVPTQSLVIRARFVGNVEFVDVFEGEGWVTSVASEVFTLVAGQEDLWGQFIIRPSSLSGDLDSVSQSGGDSESPA